MPGWVPEAGAIVGVNFDPQARREQAGREQAGHRPAVVLSQASYNRRSGLMLCVPMTTRVKNYPFEVMIEGAQVGVAIADHVRSVDWRARGARPMGHVGADELEAIRQIVRGLAGG